MLDLVFCPIRIKWSLCASFRSARVLNVFLGQHQNKINNPMIHTITKIVSHFHHHNTNNKTNFKVHLCKKRKVKSNCTITSLRFYVE